MKILDWKFAIESAALMAVVQLLIAGGSYLTGCAIFGDFECSLNHGVKWIAHHPVFPDLAPKLILAGFFVGLFTPLLGTIASVAGKKIPQPVKFFVDKHKNLFAPVIVALLIAAFALWGLPEVLLLRRLEAGAPN